MALTDHVWSILVALESTPTPCNGSPPKVVVAGVVVMGWTLTDVGSARIVEALLVVPERLPVSGRLLLLVHWGGAEAQVRKEPV